MAAFALGREIKQSKNAMKISANRGGLELKNNAPIGIGEVEFPDTTAPIV